MKDTQYAFAVSSVRFKENELPSHSFLNQLAETPDFKSAISLLKDKGFNFEKSENISNAVNKKMKELQDYMKEILPNEQDLWFLIVKNDFHNLKASLKSVITNEKNPPFIFPCITSPNDILKAVKEKNFEDLPEFLKDCAKEAYEILTSSKDGRLTELYIDKNALLTSLEFAKNSKNTFSEEIAELNVVFSNIKIALRLSDAKKSDVIYDYAFIPCSSIDINALKSACEKGKEEVYHYLETTPYSYVCQYKNNMALLEKILEEKLFQLCDKVSLISFGCEPLIAYYMKFDGVMKNIRIILSCKRIGIEANVIKERMREIYV